MACASMFAVSSCGDDEEENGGSSQQSEVKLVSSSIKEGEEVDAYKTTSLTLTYNGSVSVTSNADVTLNGKKVAIASNTSNTSEVILSFYLEEETSYTLKVPAGTIKSRTIAKASADEFILNFRTKKASPSGDDEDMSAVPRLGWGWNLGNHFDTSSGKDGVPNQWGWWDGATPTQALYDNLAKIGVTTVRMPVTWGNYQGEGPEYTISTDYMETVAKNVQWALDAGLYVVLNTHHDEYWQDIIGAAADAKLNTAIEERITTTWTQIANRFKRANGHLIFETFNELHDEKWGWNGSYNYNPVYKLMNEWNQIAVDAIRATGGKNATRWIGVPGFCANPQFTIKNLTLPKDPANHIMVGVHIYDPFNFCTEGSVQRWGHTYRGNSSDEDAIKSLLASLKTAYVDKGIPCYIGEYGVTVRKNAADEKYRTYYLEYFCRAAYTYGLPVMLWDNNNNKTSDGGGECFYFISHADGTLYNRPLVELMIKAATSTDPDYTLDSVWDSAPAK